MDIEEFGGKGRINEITELTKQTSKGIISLNSLTLS